MTVKRLMAHRVYGLGRNERHHYPSYAPKVLLHRVRHWAIGPLMGCSCSRCFPKRWRMVWSPTFLDERVRNARAHEALDNRLRQLEGKPK